MFSTNSSGHNGICRDKVHDKWRAYITVDYKNINLGSYKELKEAIAARKQDEIKYWGKTYQGAEVNDYE